MDDSLIFAILRFIEGFREANGDKRQEFPFIQENRSTPQSIEARSDDDGANRRQSPLLVDRLGGMNALKESFLVFASFRRPMKVFLLLTDRTTMTFRISAVARNELMISDGEILRAAHYFATRTSG